MISATVQHAMADFDAAMGQYVGVSKRSIPEIVAQKGAQIIYGNKSPAYPGLHAALRELSPARGAVTMGRLRALRNTHRSARRPVKVRPRAKQKALDLLAGQPSGMFSFFKVGSSDRFVLRKVSAPPVVTPRAKNTNPRNESKTPGKTSVVPRRQKLVSATKRSPKLRVDRKLTHTGDKRLNAPALAIALEIMMREAGRGYVATGFLPKRYSKLLAFGRSRRATIRPQGLQSAVNTPTPAASMTVAAQNLKGRQLGVAQFSSAGNGAALRILGFTPPQSRPAAQAAVARVINYVRADTMAYVTRKLEKDKAAAFANIRRIRK
jgi:hypothetical protein